jgi:hypothetical protein
MVHISRIVSKFWELCIMEDLNVLPSNWKNFFSNNSTISCEIPVSFQKVSRSELCWHLHIIYLTWSVLLYPL